MRGVAYEELERDRGGERARRSSAGERSLVRLGQNFLADTNLLDAIVREAELEPDDVVLEVGGGEGALTERLAAAAAHVHVIELDQRLRPALEAVAADRPNVELHWGDAMRLDLAALDPAPTADGRQPALLDRDAAAAADDRRAARARGAGR